MPKDLETLLRNLKLEKYYNALDAVGVRDIETFCLLDDNQLREHVGIQLLGPRRKMTSAIAKLRVTR